MENSQQINPIPSPPVKKSYLPLIIAVIAIIIVIFVAILVASSLDNNSDGGNNDYDPADIRYVSGTYSQETLSGDVTVKAKLTNLGGDVGSVTINVVITESSGTYSNTKYVTLAPGETVTYDIKVNTPFGTGVDGNMINVYLT